ncbi:hypothetical protein F4801DRAFT_305349 [Xylaria longipes]|nr:hypothetical protein F4801DRAFT_305349 [Xylaria longipes]
MLQNIHCFILSWIVLSLGSWQMSIPRSCVVLLGFALGDHLLLCRRRASSPFPTEVVHLGLQDASLQHEPKNPVIPPVSKSLLICYASARKYARLLRRRTLLIHANKSNPIQAWLETSVAYCSMKALPRILGLLRSGPFEAVSERLL